jgi:hypothetical protein
MARPIKQGVEYFPMDVEIDDKIELIEAKHGIAGFGILIKLYQKIYKEGYFCKWNEEALLIFSKRINVDSVKVSEVVNDCLHYNLFNENLFKEYSILTSSGIQDRYFKIVEKRKQVDVIEKYIITDIYSINSNINLINSSCGTQSKVKESKVKESKGKEFLPPVLEDVILYFKENGYSEESARRAFKYYTEMNWHDRDGKQVLSWKGKMVSVWFKSENQIKASVFDKYLNKAENG